MSDDAKVYFGHERVSPAEKTERVGKVFAAVAGRYDAMNDVMSFGTHRLLKRLVVESSGVRANSRVLDLAGGTGDLARRFAEIVDDRGLVVLSDINEEMLRRGRDRLLDEGVCDVRCVLANAEQLPFADNQFDIVTIAFGLRNVASKEQALREMRRVLKPRGRLLVLEFSRPRNATMQTLSLAWQSLWPKLGEVLVGDAQPYRYLVDSIATHPDQEQLSAMLTAAGFGEVHCEDLLGGVVALHRAAKPIRSESHASP